jgi:hypothetical protein
MVPSQPPTTSVFEFGEKVKEHGRPRFFKRDSPRRAKAPSGRFSFAAVVPWEDGCPAAEDVRPPSRTPVVTRREKRGCRRHLLN